MALRSVQPEELHGGLRSTGSHQLHISVQAFCQCGWAGPSHPWAGTRDAERKELDAHLADTGHRPFLAGAPAPAGYHVACDHFHDLNDACPVAPDSPAGRLRRVTNGSTLGYPARALDRLRAIEELRAWLDEEETEAAIGARMTRCTWSEMGQAIGASRQAAWNRWGQMIARYEKAGLLDPEAEPDIG